MYQPSSIDVHQERATWKACVSPLFIDNHIFFFFFYFRLYTLTNSATHNKEYFCFVAFSLEVFLTIFISFEVLSVVSYDLSRLAMKHKGIGFSTALCGLLR